MALVPKLAQPLGHMFYIGLYNYETLLIVKFETTEPRVYIWHEASSSRFTKLVEKYGPVAENEAASGIKVIYSLYREHFKTHSCQILKGLMFDILHHQVILCQVCSNYSSVVKMASSWRSQSL